MKRLSITRLLVLTIIVVVVIGGVWVSYLVWKEQLSPRDSSAKKAKTIYVSSGVGSDQTCANDTNTGLSAVCTSGKNGPVKTFAAANKLVEPGDTVQIRGGTYKETIRPLISGTNGLPITYTRYQNEEPIITGVTYAVNLAERSYIIIEKLKIMNINRYWINMEPRSSYNIIRDNYMEEAKGWGGIYLRYDSNWNKIQRNTLVAYRGPYDPIFVFDSSYNLVEDNNIRYGTHTSINVQKRTHTTVFNVIRNNSVYNPWHHTMNIYENADYSLVEGNYLTDAGADYKNNITGQPGDLKFPRENHNGIEVGASYGVYRQNILINNGSGISIDSYDSPAARSFNNHVYHNTFLNNVMGVYTNSRLSVRGNVIKNNIFYKQQKREIYREIQSSDNKNYYVLNAIFTALTKPIQYNRIALTLTEAQTTYSDTFRKNITQDPQMVDPTKRNVALRSTSPMIDKAQPLTYTASAGNGTVLQLSDAGYFYDGGGVVPADWIKIGSAEPVQITKVNYTNNTITLAATRSWSKEASVYLYKNSSGKVVFYGKAPDYGAMEFVK